MNSVMKKETDRWIHPLAEYGYTPFFASQIGQNETDAGLVPARVVSIQRECCRVVSETGENNAKLKGSLFYQTPEIIRYPAVGDFVLIKPNPSGDDILYRVLERKSCFSRHNPSTTAVSWYENQIAATNFDYVFIMSSLNEDLNFKRLDRYAATAWQSGGRPVICLTKADLCEPEEAEAACAEVSVHFPGIGVTAVSSLTGYGIERLAPYQKPGVTICFLGSSGIGKSTLLNTLAGKSLMKTNDVRETDSKGRHTTTHRELFRLSNGVLLIDTPGMRELGLWEAAEGISQVFSDIEELASRCRFADCKHEKEPGCAVRNAIEEGTLTEAHLISYRKLLRESNHAERKAAHLRVKTETALKSYGKTKEKRKKSGWETDD